MAYSDRPVWRFENAIVREPSASAVDGLRAVDRGAPSIDALRAEHRAYVDALTAAGVTVDILPPLEDFPDSMFVEDPALVFPDCAIALRPGAPSRLGETARIEPVLKARFPSFHTLPCLGYVDGGDILVTPHRVYIGLSARTDRTGAGALASILADTGRAAKIVATPPGILHLKTACSLLDGETVLATRAMRDAGLFEDMETILVAEGEEAAANALRVNDVVLLGSAFAQTRSRLEEAGFDVVGVPVEEVGKLDAGLSCMSLRW
ncbi:arginine deiminase family protein [Microbaculum marinum]|uniref:Arginine deiminase family protein n=1 Tax=Microbaculum marinum TaxID=1764581 RepID=A0AAW9RX22_9HYPH